MGKPGRPFQNTGQLRRALYSQTLAAFGTTCVDDGTTATGFHTNQKAVGALAAGNGGLESAFHRKSKYQRAGLARTKPRVPVLETCIKPVISSDFDAFVKYWSGSDSRDGGYYRWVTSTRLVDNFTLIRVESKFT